MTRIVVINLDSARERWSHISKQLSRQGLSAERFPGVNGKTDDHPLFDRYDKKLRLSCKGSELSPGQLGCFASHFLVWQRCLSLDEPVIVLEDDVTLPGERLKRFVELVDRLDDRFECVRLFKNRTKHHKSIPVRAIDGFTLVKYTKGPMSGMGYYLTPAGAKKLLAAADTWFLAVDMYMDRFWANGVECFGVVPECVQHDYLFDSTIGYESEKIRRPISVTFRRELFSMVEGARRFRKNSRFRLTRLSSIFFSPDEGVR